MARLQRQYRKQARTQARAETLPQIKGVQHGLHNQVAGLRTEEPYLQGGLSTAAQTIRHSPLAASDKAQLLENIATRQAGVPAGIASQIEGARESAHGEVGDLRQEQAASAASILSGLMTAHTEHTQAVADEIAAEQRQRSGAIDQSKLEQSLGLGDYATTPKTPQEEALEAATLGKVNAEAGKDEREAHGNGLTPYENLKLTEAQHEDHATAAHYAKGMLEEAKSGAVPEVPSDPHEWSEGVWSKFVTKVHENGKVPIPAAEKAVSAIRAHYQSPGDPFGLIAKTAQAAAGVVGGAGTAQAAAPAPSSHAPAALLSMLGGAPTGVPELHGRRY